MSEDRNMPFHDDFDHELIRRYEENLTRNSRFYFDVHEFEEVIDFYIENNKYDEALNAVKIAEKQHPQSSIIRMKNAQILIDEGEPVKALKILQGIEQIEGNNIDIYLLKAAAYNIIGNTREAMRYYEFALNNNAEDREELLYNIGVAFESTMNYEIALRYFHEAHQINPTNVSVIYDIAFCYEKLLDLEKAAEYYNKYLDIDAYSELVWYKLGGVHERGNNYTEALNAYDFAIAIEENFSLAYLSKANMLILNGELLQAIQVYQAFLLMEEDYLDVYCTVGACYDELGYTDEALAYFNKAIEMDPNFSEPYYAKANLYYTQGKLKEAYRQIKKAVACYENADEYWLLFGEIAGRLSYSKLAENAYRKSISLNPSNIFNWLGYAEFLYNQFRMHEAVILLEQGEDLLSEIPDFYLYYGAILVADNNKKMGIKMLKKGIKMLAEYDETPTMRMLNLLRMGVHPDVLDILNKK